MFVEIHKARVEAVRKAGAPKRAACWHHNAAAGGLMAYMRGPSYIWRDDHHVHIWADDGFDGWAEAGWSEGRKHSVPDSTPYGEASGVGIRQEIADVYVVMRLAELVCEQRVGTVVASAVATFGGNSGCLALQRLAPALASNLEPIGSEPAAVEIRNLWSKPFAD